MGDGSAPLGVRVVDRVLPAPPRGASWALVHQPGIQATPFLYEAVGARLREGGRVLYVALDRHPRLLLQEMRGWGLDASLGDRLELVDGYSRRAGAASGGALRVDGPEDAAGIVDVVSRAATPDTLVVVESLSAMVDHAQDFTSLAIGLRRILGAAKGSYALLAAFTRWPYALPAEALLEAFDAVVSLNGYYGHAAFGQYVQVSRAGWAPRAPTRQVSVRTVPGRGIQEYVPKILVTGPYHAGKSSLIRSISERAVEGSALGTTVVADHGELALDGLTADLFGTPGQERFDPLLRTLAGQALGVVLVVDATDPASFPRAHAMMRATRGSGIPLLVLANKQDQPDALPPEEVARLLPAPPGVLVRGCVARERASALGPLRELLDAIREPPVVA